jgi:hypothetical protein
MAFNFANILQAVGGQEPWAAQRQGMGSGMGPLMQVDPNRYLTDTAPQAVTPDPVPQNIMQSMASPEMPQNVDPAQMKPARERRSIVDIIGRIADGVAIAGGAPAQYQPYLDAREDRSMAQEDRTRQIDLDALRKQISEQQLKTGGMAIEGDERARLAQGLGAIANNPDAAAMWPQIAEQLQISPERAAQVGEILAKNPQAAGVFAQSLGYEPPKQASKAKEVQIFEYMQSLPEDQREAFKETLVKEMNPYQAAQFELAMKKFEFDQFTYANPQPTEAMRNRAAGIGPAPKGAAAGGGNMQKAALDNLDELSAVYDDLNEIGGLVSSKNSTVSNITTRARASGIGQLLEGAVGTEAQTLRDRIASIRPALMQSIAKATGMTGKQLDSNADVKLFMQTVTDPTTSYEANKRAIEGLKRFINSSAAPAARPARPAAKPRYAPSPNRKPVVSPNANAAALAEARRRGLIK